MPIETYTNRAAQLTLLLFPVVVVTIGLALLAQKGSLVTGLVYALSGAFLAFRVLHSCCVTIGESDVRTRSVLRTRRYRFSELAEVEVRVSRTGWLGFWNREYLVFCLVDGRRIAFRDLNSRSGPRNEESVVRRAAASINRRIHP